MNPEASPFSNPPAFHSDDIPPSSPETAAFHIIPAPWETSVSYGGGTAHGPAAILHASTQLEAYLDGGVPGASGIYTAPFVNCDTDPEATLERVREPIGIALGHGKIPILLGGEHAVTLGPILEIKSRGIDFGVVQFDAHADLRNSYQGNNYSHACVMRRIHDLKIPIFQIGIRSLSASEAEFRETNRILHLDADEIAKSGFPLTILPTNFPKSVHHIRCGRFGSLSSPEYRNTRARRAQLVSGHRRTGECDEREEGNRSRCRRACPRSFSTCLRFHHG